MSTDNNDSKGNLALFDFDGTITYKDSFIEILKFHKGLFYFYLKFLFLGPYLVLFKLKLIPAMRAKEIVLSAFFKGMKYSTFQNLCLEFSKEKLSRIVRKDALIKLKEHKNNADRVIVVSASIEEWLTYWCNEQDIELVGTRLQVKDDRLTGEINGKNCNGIEKVHRIKEILDINQYQNVYVYGDSIGDKELLQMASHPNFRVF